MTMTMVHALHLLHLSHLLPLLLFRQRPFLYLLLWPLQSPQALPKEMTMFPGLSLWAISYYYITCDCIFYDLLPFLSLS